MTLINCPECKSKISDNSLKCKDCGFPVKGTKKIKKNSKRRSIGAFIDQINIVQKILFLLFILNLFFYELYWDSFGSDGDIFYAGVSIVFSLAIFLFKTKKIK